MSSTYERATRSYSDEPRPLRSYAALTGLFATAVGGSLVAARLKRSRPSAGFRVGDIILMGVATQRLSRLIAKDTVTSFLRAPFTRYVEPGAPGEVNEEPRGEGLQRAVGELIGCPFCLAQWVAAGFTCGLLLAPETTRVIATVYAAESISDFLQLIYSAVESKAE